MKSLLKMSHGDTIVEVLIAVAVMGLVLAGAFTIANRSSTSIRQAQEHSEALEIAQTQIEQLKYLAGTLNNGGIFTTSNNFCTYGNGATIQVLASSNPNCKKTSGVSYGITISRVDGVPATKQIFMVKVQWDSLVSTSKDSVQLSYDLDKT